MMGYCNRGAWLPPMHVLPTKQSETGCPYFAVTVALTAPAGVQGPASVSTKADPVAVPVYVALVDLCCSEEALEVVRSALQAALESLPAAARFGLVTFFPPGEPRLSPVSPSCHQVKAVASAHQSAVKYT